LEYHYNRPLAIKHYSDKANSCYFFPGSLAWADDHIDRIAMEDLCGEDR
jgi:hypothetical protein